MEFFDIFFQNSIGALRVILLTFFGFALVIVFWNIITQKMSEKSRKLGEKKNEEIKSELIVLLQGAIMNLMIRNAVPLNEYTTNLFSSVLKDFPERGLINADGKWRCDFENLKTYIYHNHRSTDINEAVKMTCLMLERVVVDKKMPIVEKVMILHNAMNITRSHLDKEVLVEVALAGH